MSSRTALIAVIWAATTAGAVAFAIGSVSLLGDQPNSAFRLVLVALAADVEVFALVGAFLAIRRPGNLVASVLIAAGALDAITFCGFVYGASRSPDDLSAGVASLVAGLAVVPALMLTGPALALVFPDGRSPGRRWRRAIVVIVATLMIGLLLSLVRPGPVNDGLAINPLGIPADLWTQWPGIDRTLANLALEASLVLGFAAVAVRYRRGTGGERAQLRWFLAANVATVVLLSMSSLDGGVGVTAFDVLGVVSLALPPIAVGIAVMRYRLYEIDRLISRGLSWAVLSGALLAVYAGAVLLLQTVLGDVIQGQTVAVAGSTLLAAALFQPLRRRVQATVDHRFNRARYDAERTATDFAERLRDEMDIEHLSTDLATTAGGAVHPAGVGVWLRPTPGPAR